MYSLDIHANLTVLPQSAVCLSARVSQTLTDMHKIEGIQRSRTHSSPPPASDPSLEF